MKFVFLDYLSRSGSTLLAKKLDSLQGIKVTIEAHSILYTYVKQGPLIDESRLDNYLKELGKDEKFNYWGVDLPKLRNELNKSYPIKFLTIIEKILEQSTNESPQIVILKGFDYYLFEPFLRKQGAVKSIFIVRDFRAVFNSQKSSLNSQTNRPFVSNVFRYLLKTDYHLSKVLKTSENMMVVKYEDMVRDIDKTIEEVANFIGLTRVLPSSAEDYFDKIPKSQQHLHSLTKGKGDIDESRRDLWKKSLSKFEAKIIEIYLQKYFVEFGYNIGRKKERWRLLYYLLCIVLRGRIFMKKTINMCGNLKTRKW